MIGRSVSCQSTENSWPTSPTKLCRFQVKCDDLVLFYITMRLICWVFDNCQRDLKKILETIRRRHLESCGVVDSTF